MSDELNEFGQKKAYSFDAITYEYLGVIWADPDQLAQGEYLLPSNATFTPLDDAADGFVAIYKGNNKKFVKDNRGTEYWETDGTKHTVNNLNEEIPSDALFAEPIIEPTDIEKAEAARIERDALLTETDYMMMPDYPLEDKTPWLEYRQVLRNLSKQTNFPNEIEWPVKPF